MSFSPAMANVRAMTAKTKTRERDLDIDFYSVRGNEDNSLYIDDVETPVAPVTNILDVLLPNDKLSEQLKELNASKTYLIDLVDKTVSGGKTVTSSSLDEIESKSPIRPSSSLSTIPGSGRNFHVPSAVSTVLSSVPEDKPLSSPSKISLEVSIYLFFIPYGYLNVYMVIAANVT